MYNYILKNILFFTVILKFVTLDAASSGIYIITKLN